MYWVISELEDDKDDFCTHRWIAFPASLDTLDDVIKIAEINSKKFWVTKNMRYEKQTLYEIVDKER